MMISSPIPPAAAAAAAPPAAAPAAAAPPTGPAPAPPAAEDVPGTAATAPKPDDGPPVPTKEQAIRETMSMSAQDAAAAVASNFETLGKLTIGGGTKEGLEHAKLASMLLSNSSSLLQLAHLKASEHLRSLADELDMQMMGAATNLAFVGGQVALAGGSKTPISVAELAAEPIARSSAALADVLAAIAPQAAPAPAPAPDAPAGGDAAPAPSPNAPAPSPNAPAPNALAPSPAAVSPSGMQQVTPGPGAGRGPNPA